MNLSREFIGLVICILFFGAALYVILGLIESLKGALL